MARGNVKLMEFLDVPIFDDDIYKLVVRFAINLVFLYLVVGISYWLHQQNHRQVFNLLVMNVVVYYMSRYGYIHVKHSFENTFTCTEIPPAAAASINN